MAHTHGQLKVVFNALLDQPPHARAAYLSYGFKTCCDEWLLTSPRCVTALAFAKTRRCLR